MKTEEKNNEIIAKEAENQMENFQLDQNEFAEKLAGIIANQKSVNMLLLKGFIASEVKIFNYGTWEKYSFTLGVSERRWNGKTFEFYNQYLPITLTSTLADIVGKQYKKGNEIIVLATIHRRVRDVDGQKKVYYDIKANDLYSADKTKTAMVA
ncbi:MAG TPA: single-stranded DNA-binding protein [Bacteroidales bacterium]|nr:single-stranded DNA-binding protein [Bacteroidales bacterium]